MLRRLFGRLFERKAKPSRDYLKALAIIEDQGGYPDAALTHRLMMHDPVVSFAARHAEDLLLYRQERGIPVPERSAHDRLSAQLEAQFQHMLVDELAGYGQKDSEFATQVRLNLITRLLSSKPTTK